MSSQRNALEESSEWWIVRGDIEKEKEGAGVCACECPPVSCVIRLLVRWNC